MTIPLLKHLQKLPPVKKSDIPRIIRSAVWFTLGGIVGFFFFVSFLYIAYRQTHTNLVYDGVMINGIDFGGQTEEQVEAYFANKNKDLQNVVFILKDEETTASISAKQLGFGYDAPLLAHQAFSIGRTNNSISNMSLMLQAYTEGLSLSAAYRYEEGKVDKLLKPIQERVTVAPEEGLFNFADGQVVEVRPAINGHAIDTAKLKQQIKTHLLAAAYTKTEQTVTLPIPVVTIKPKVTVDNINDLGIKEVIGEGTSLFQHSIEGRAFNVNLAASRLNGILIPPSKTFSFTETIGDISSLSGYKQAYVIENGKTVLGDGGGVCQVSTTLFRAALNAGLPIVERNPHAYRVGYYEQDSGPGIDAAIYSPSVDLKFKNDTDNYILVQSAADMTEQRLTFWLYGTKDDRQTIIGTPVIESESPAPEALYQDDPTLPKGQVKQVDFAAAGANVYFTRTVKKQGKVIQSDKFVSNYRPWQAIYLRGTKE